MKERMITEKIAHVMGQRTTRRNILKAGVLGLGGLATGCFSSSSAEKPKSALESEAASEVVDKEIINKMELPKPAAWDHVPSVSLVKTVNVPSFPKTREEAAATFGVDGSTRDPKRWEKTPEGDGWHLSEAQIGDDTKDALNVNPKGYLVEGYYDTKPGRNPFAWVAVGIDSNIPAQGATFWNERRKEQAEKLQKEMAIPMWKDENGKVTPYPATIIIPNQDQKTEAQSATPIKYPETADKAVSLFGGKPENWDRNPEGGWHLKPQDNEVEVSLGGFTMDGYNKEGLLVAGGSVKVKVLGGTVWPVSGPAELKKLVEAVQANNPGKRIQVAGVQ